METHLVTFAELEGKPGIKAQHAVYRALKEILAEVKSGWDVEETKPGSEEDRYGIDIWLVNRQTGDSYILDISFRRKENDAFLVLVHNDWFVTNDDGSWSVRRECRGALVQAIKPVLSVPAVKRPGARR